MLLPTNLPDVTHYVTVFGSRPARRYPVHT